MENPLPTNEREKDLAEFWTKQGVNHQKPSKETLEIFKKMGEEIKKIEITQAEHGKDIAYIKDGIGEIKEFVKKADECYVNKDTFDTYKSENGDELKALKALIGKAFWIALGTLLSMIAWVFKFFIEKIYESLS